MPFTFANMRQWQAGSHLTEAEDLVPEGAMRLGVNVRLDAVRGVPTSRLGMTLLASAFGGIIRMLNQLYGVAADYGYVQVSNAATSILYRTTAAWASATSLLSGLQDAPLASTNFVDGYTRPWRVFVGSTRTKDNGTTLTQFGLDPPASPPAIASLGSSGRIVLWACDSVTNVTAVGAYGVDTAVKQEGTGSFFQVIPASTTLTFFLGMGAAGTVAAHGTHTGANGATHLTDAATTLTGTNVQRGSFVLSGGGAYGVVTRVTTHDVYCDGGVSGSGVFNTGDSYAIYYNLEDSGLQPGNAAGTATGGSTTSLIDTTKDFVYEGVTAGMQLWNTTTGAVGDITSVGQTTNPHDTLYVTGGMSGGSAATITAGHTYKVLNNLGSDDDVIHLWLRCDKPEAVAYIALTFEAIVTGIASTPTYTIRLSRDRFAPTANQWTELRLRKSEFTPIGTPGALGWRAISLISFLVQTTNLGAVTLWVDDVSFLGGVGIEGEQRYTAIYVNQTTGARSAPPKTVDEVVLYTDLITTQRQAVTLNLTSIATPSDPQVTHLWLYRLSQTLPDITFVAAVPVGTTSFTDTYGDVQLDNAKILEPDNDRVPSSTTVIFGPGALNRLFALYDRHKLRYSKAWEPRVSRLEAWPSTNELLISDGSEEALNGIVMDQTIFIWTEASTWEVLGQGPDTFVPLPVPLSHGLAARWAMTFGDQRIFFLSQDGIYEQVGLTQQKLTRAIDPFFLGQTVHGHLPLNRTYRGLCHLRWFPHPTGNQLVLLYPAMGSTTLNKRLVLKQNPQSGQYTDAFFDDGPGADVVTAQLYDPQALTLLFGTAAGAIYQAEAGGATSDAGAAIVGRLRTGARDDGAPRLVKTYSDLLFDVNTGGATLTVSASFDRSTSTVAAGTVASSSDQAMTQLVLPQTTTPATLRRHNLALDLTWSATTAVVLHQIGYHVSLEAEDVTFLDSGPLTFDTQALVRRLHFEGDLPATVTGTLTVDGVAVPAVTLAATSGRQRLDALISSLTPLYRGKVFRLTLTSGTPFLLYSALGEFEQEPLPVTLWDSREVTFPTPHIWRHLLLTLEAPAAVTLTIVVDGVAFLTTTVGPTSGRVRLDQLVTAVSTLARGRTFRLGLSSAQLFQVWGLTGLFEAEPLPTTFWDSRSLASVGIQAVKWVAFDLEASSALTVTTYLDGVARDVRTLGPTSGRQRVNHLLPAGLKGHTVRLTATATQPFQLWQVQPMQKAWGRAQGYTPAPALEAFQGLQQESVMATVDGQRVERALFGGGG
jgi:hypothetical protein